MRILATLSAALPITSIALACSSNDGIPGAAAVTPTSAPEQEQSEPPRADDDPGGDVLTEEMAAPYFESGRAGEAAAAFRLERFELARDGFAAALAAEDAPDDARDRARMRLLEGLAHAELDAWEEAAAALAEVRDELPLISDFIGYHAARAHYFAGELDEANELAESVSPESTSGRDAALLLGDILRRQGDAEATAEHYARYLEDGHRVRRSEARFRLAEAREALGDTDAETLRHYRRITIYAPLSEWAEPASERIAALTAELPEAERDELAALSAEEHLARGMAYYGSMRNEKAAADLERALAAGELDTDQRCRAAFHRAHSWYRARDRRKSAPLFDEAIELCNETDDQDLQVRAAYLAGRSYSRIGEPKTSIARHALIEEHHPDHSYADDARLRQAEQYANLDEDDKVVELLSTIPKLYPDDDMRGEAMWRLAWRSFKDEEYEEAIGWLEKKVETEPIAQNYWAEGQAQYWMGRAHAELGQTETSIAAYEDAVRTYPLTYYALLSLNRLREQHPWHFQELVGEIGRAPEGEQAADQPAFSFRPRPLYGKPGFRRGIELMRLGLGEAAEAEFRRLGLTPPSHRRAVEDPDQAEKLWAMALLYDRAGRYRTSHWPTRWHLVDYKRHWPVGRHRARWRIAYPNAWWEVLDRHASNHEFSTALQIALVREESAFDPLIESWANAVGLTQLILPTARRFARGTGIEVSRETLRDPDVNAMIGARFLDFLHERYDGHPMLMVPAYNAGEGAVDRWLRARGELPADAWIEELRVDQPRRYTKRLLGSYFAYAYLNEGRIPELSNELPGR